MSLISSYLDTAPASPGAAPQAQLRWALPLEHCAKLGAAQLGGKGLGLARMIGGMVETRLGMTTAAHVAVALGGVDFVDLDTAWLLREDPFVGGYQAVGPEYVLPEAPGLGVARRA